MYLGSAASGETFESLLGAPQDLLRFGDAMWVVPQENLREVAQGIVTNFSEHASPIRDLLAAKGPSETLCVSGWSSMMTIDFTS